ncbi:hypothetical protein Tsubulata_008426 [Turnera subulata]|uniref:CCHC-type domain-containing protein n=1 Tax=Turnera subulata TaxID=218843 RepID=A0A9Q0FSK9_9ROSI|nr:hypothetical protein Tsubulata_008426 [Turnera subulata]
MTRVWSLKTPVGVTEVEDNMFIFWFFPLVEKERMLSGSAWNFSGLLLFLKEWDAKVALAAMDFSDAPIWVQVWDMPPEHMIMRRATKIRELFNGVDDIELPKDNSIFWDKFFQMRVRIKLKDPLPTGFLNKRLGDEAFWVNFQYENLVDYCYYCARLGHVKKECPQLEEDHQNGRRKAEPMVGIFSMRATRKGKQSVLFKPNVPKSPKIRIQYAGGLRKSPKSEGGRWEIKIGDWQSKGVCATYIGRETFTYHLWCTCPLLGLGTTPSLAPPQEPSPHVDKPRPDENPSWPPALSLKKQAWARGLAEHLTPSPFKGVQIKWWLAVSHKEDYELNCLELSRAWANCDSSSPEEA